MLETWLVGKKGTGNMSQGVSRSSSSFRNSEDHARDHRAHNFELQDETDDAKGQVHTLGLRAHHFELQDETDDAKGQAHTLGMRS